MRVHYIHIPTYSVFLLLPPSLSLSLSLSFSFSFCLSLSVSLSLSFLFLPLRTTLPTVNNGDKATSWCIYNHTHFSASNNSPGPLAQDLDYSDMSNPMLIKFNVEISSAGAGTLLNLETPAPQEADVPRKLSAQDFFSQLNWAEQTSGSAEYAPFQDHLGSGSDFSSDSDDDFNNICHDPFFSAPNSKEGNAPVNFDGFESESGSGHNDHSRQGQGKSRKLPTPQSNRQEEAKLIELSIAEDEDETVK